MMAPKAPTSPLKSAAKSMVAPKAKAEPKAKVEPKDPKAEKVVTAEKSEESKTDKVEATLPPIKAEELPSYPRKIDFKQLADEVKRAAELGFTPLVVCNGHAKEADTFFTYGGYTQIDAKWILAETAIKKTTSVEDMQEDLRRKVVGSIKHGIPVHVAMANSAVSFKEKFCTEKGLPQCFFNRKEFEGNALSDVKERPYHKMLKEEDFKDWPGVPGYMKSGWYVVITTDFSMENYKEFLTDALPHLDQMVVIEIDSASFT